MRSNAQFLLAHPAAAAEDREAALRDIAGESDRMARMVDGLLTLARADAGQRLSLSPLDLGDLAEEEKQVVNGLGFAATIGRIRVDLLGMDWEDAGYARRCFRIRAWQSRSTNATSWRTASSAVYSVAARESQLKPQS